MISLLRITNLFLKFWFGVHFRWLQRVEMLPNYFQPLLKMSSQKMQKLKSLYTCI